MIVRAASLGLPSRSLVAQNAPVRVHAWLWAVHDGRRPVHSELPSQEMTCSHLTLGISNFARILGVVVERTCRRGRTELFAILFRILFFFRSIWAPTILLFWG